MSGHMRLSTIIITLTPITTGDVVMHEALRLLRYLRTHILHSTTITADNCVSHNDMSLLPVVGANRLNQLANTNIHL